MLEKGRCNRIWETGARGSWIEASLGYIERLCLKQQQNQKTKTKISQTKDIYLKKAESNDSLLGTYLSSSSAQAADNIQACEDTVAVTRRL